MHQFVVKSALAGTAISLAAAVPSFGAIWDGGNPASPDASGNWNVVDNWDTGLVPIGTTDVLLDTVTTGTRTITQDLAAAEANSLAITQANNLGTNVLSLSQSLTLNKTTAPYVVTRSGGATVDKVQVNLNGNVLTMKAATTAIGGTLNFNAAGSQLAINLGVANSVTTFSGDVNVTANGSLSRIVPGNNTGNTNFTFASGSTADLTAGTLRVEYVGQHGTDNDPLNVNVNAGAVMTISTGAGLSMNYLATTGSANNFDFVPQIINAGTVSHGGAISFQAARRGAPGTPLTSNVTNTGTWRIAGVGAQVNRLTSHLDANYLAVPVINNNGAGVFVGDGAANVLEYDEQIDKDTRLLLNNNATIAPGNGTNQSALTSVGVMTLRDTDVTFGTAGKLNIDVGGTTAGQFDVLSLATGVTDPAGAGTLDLSATGDRLNITLVNGFVAGETGFSIPILDYGSVALTGGVGFDVLSINGLTTNAPTYDNGVGIFSIQYNATSANLLYTVPEPASLGLLMLGAVGLLRRR